MHTRTLSSHGYAVNQLSTVYNSIGSVKVNGYYLCGWGSVSFETTVFSHCLLKPCFMCSDQHVNFCMLCGFPMTIGLLLDYHVMQYLHTYIHTHMHGYSFNACAIYTYRLLKLHQSKYTQFYPILKIISSEYTIWLSSVCYGTEAKDCHCLRRS